MNRAEYQIAEGIGFAVGWTLRLLWDLTILLVLPILAAAAVGLFWLHDWLTSQVLEVLDLPDSFLARVLVGAVLLPVIAAIAATALAAVGFASFFLVTAELPLAIKTFLALVSLGACLSTLAFARERLLGGVDAELDLDFGHLWDE